MHDAAEQIERLQRVLAVSRQMAATTDLDALLGMIVDAACQTLDCERATIFLHDPERRELYSRVAKGIDGQPLRFPADRGIAGAAAQSRGIVHVPDAYADPRFNQEIDRKTGFRTRNLLTFPLENIDGRLMGVLQALNKHREHPFDAADIELAQILSAQAGVALHRQQLIEEYAEKRRMARELELAEQIQRAYLPKQDPSVAGYDITGWNRSADQTGGDCFDFMALPDGRHALLLADATGHGIGAALVISQCRSLLRAALSVTGDLAAAVNRMNRLLVDDLSDDRFVTAFVGVLDPRGHTLEYISGGQGPLLFLDGDQAEALNASGLPFGIIADFTYELQRYELQPGGIVALLTDGFYETARADGEMFGEERVIDLLRRSATTPLPDVVSRLYAAVLEFRGAEAQADDLTAVLLRRRPE